MEEIQQDPYYTAVGPNHIAIGIPRCAFPSSRDMPCTALSSDHVLGSGNLDDQVHDPVALVSEDEDVADLMFLFSEDEESQTQVKGKGKSRKADDDPMMM